MIKIILVITALVVILGGGGGYWYLEVYQPAEYAKAAVALYKEWRDGTESNKASIIAKEKGVYDYVATLETLQSLEEFLVQEQAKLSNLKSPFLSGIAKQFHADFSEFLNKSVEMVRNAKNRAKFVAKAQEYENLFSEKGDAPVIIGKQSAPIALRMRTPEEMWREFETKIPRAKTLGSALFAEEITRLNGISFSQLKTAWKETSPAFDILIQNKGLNADTARKIENFNKLIHETVRLNDVYALLSGTAVGDVPIFTGDGSLTNSVAPQELVVLASKLNNDLWNLLQKYPTLSVGHNIYPSNAGTKNATPIMESGGEETKRN